MPDVSTTYLGLPVASPLVVAASPVSSYLDRIRQAEDHGAGALVIRSLFEEQLILEAELEEFFPNDLDKPRRTYFPNMKRGGINEHLYWVKQARKAVSMPLIGSINALKIGNWAHYAKAMVEAGCDAIELNVYSVPGDSHVPGAAVEEQLYSITEWVVGEVGVPVSVKLSPFYSNLANVADQVVKRGAKGLVLFNRFIQPDIDVVHEEILSDRMPLSEPSELRLPLRWIGLMAGRIKGELALSSGVHQGDDVVKGLLAGAQVVQTASALLKHGLPYLSVMNEQLQDWMRAHAYQRVEDFRGKLSGLKSNDLFAYERSQYVTLLSSQR